MNRAERVIAFLKTRPNQWTKANAFEPIGGRQAWRTAISEARQRLQGCGEGTIENRVRYVRYTPDLSFPMSEYRFVPKAVPVSVEDGTGWSLQP